ncbi:MAG: hypothetical protein HY903_10590 [Deltaproteobacteria bacterium]|nr:hypothetical protein [Deltaproteobacteria bacterium]
MYIDWRAAVTLAGVLTAAAPAAAQEAAAAADAEAATDPRLAAPTQFVPLRSPPGQDDRDEADESPRGPESPGRGKLDLGGAVQSETHYRTRAKTSGAFYNRAELAKGFCRNENKLNLKLHAGSGSATFVGDVDFDWLGIAGSQSDLAALSRYQEVAPYRLQAHALYLEVTDLLLPDLDLRVGQQVVQWGVGDQFNPTNNVNANDLENVLFFGRQVANEIVRLDYGAGSWSFSGVLVPVFKPAVLPASAALGITAVDRLPFVADELRWRLAAERELAARAGYPTVVRSAVFQLPATTPANMPWAVRVGGSLFGQDLALSYYRGRSDVPLPAESRITQIADARCDPNDAAACVAGTLTTDVVLQFPRLQVVGLNVAGELNPLGFISRGIHPFGYRLEVGLYVPEQRRMRIDQGEVVLFGLNRPAGEYDYRLPDGERPLVLDSKPFAKWVAGIDYSFGRHVYANLMWVHGMPDELGAGDFFHGGAAVRTSGSSADQTQVEICVVNRDGTACAEERLRHRIGDYAVVGVDVRFADGRGLLRLFSIWDLGGVTETSWDEDGGARLRRHRSFYSAAGWSAVLYPALEYSFGDGLTLAAGALLQLGPDYSKFGDPAAGGSLAWGRATFAF